MTSKKTMLSGIQPSNDLHLGNYLGAVRNWVGLQDEYQCFFMMVDLHAMTIPQDPAQLRESTYRGIAYYLASGIDESIATLFVQSHISAHAELAWIFNCFSYMGELNRMTQWKEKSQKQGANLPCGLFCYPNLMASDILLYQPDFVPVGDDQKQHVELTRNIAERINNRYQSDLFQMPQAYIGKEGARVMDLQDPQSKMSKSGPNPKGIVFLSDSDTKIAKKFRSAVTDSGAEVSDLESCSAGIHSLVDTMAALSDRSKEDVAKDFRGSTYGQLKVAAADLAVSVIAPIRDEADRLLKDKAHLESILSVGRNRAEQVAHTTLNRVYDAIGLIPKRLQT